MRAIFIEIFFDIFFFIVHTPQVMPTIVVVCINRDRDPDRKLGIRLWKSTVAMPDLKVRKSDNKKSLKYNQDKNPLVLSDVATVAFKIESPLFRRLSVSRGA